MNDGSGKASKEEGGILPLMVLLGLMLLILGYGVQRGFLHSSNQPIDKPIQLVLAIPSAEVDAYRKVIDRFEKTHPDVGVDLRPISGPKYYQKLLIMMASGAPPDLMWMGHGFGEFAQRDAFLDIGQLIQRDIDVKRFLPEAMAWYRSGTRQLGIPFLIDAEFIIYNKDVFDRLGMLYPTSDWDYDRFLAMAQRLTVHDQRGDITRYGYYGALDWCLFGAQFISDDGTHATCDTPQMLASMQTNWDLRTKYRVAPTSQQTHSLDRYHLFATGRAAMMQAYTTDLTSLRRQADSVQWGYVRNPKVVDQCGWASSQAVLISSKTRHPKQAWALCKQFLAPEFQESMAAIGLPSDLEVASQLAASGLSQYDHLPVLLASVGHLSALPRVAHFAEAQQIFTEAGESIWSGQSSPQEAMQRASRLINRMLKQNRHFDS
ncbi:MAG: sugar ABC transporter substrate-binding protein [Phycisphaerales bacterium]|nr:sugar ABC transporter substrate-binding protein [Phycisphaerales bacterium]